MIRITINNVSVYVKPGDIIKTRKEGLEITAEDGEYHFICKEKYKGKYVQLNV